MYTCTWYFNLPLSLALDVTIAIERDPSGGDFGVVRVDYVTLAPWEAYPYLPGGTPRADFRDFLNASGSVIFDDGQMSVTFDISIRQDTEPEVDEVVFVMLTGAYLIQGGQTLQGIYWCCWEVEHH